MYLHYGRDQALAREVRREGGGRQNSDVSSAQLQYKFNRFITFAFEQSLYRTRAIPLVATGLYPPSREGRCESSTTSAPNLARSLPSSAKLDCVFPRRNRVQAPDSFRGFFHLPCLLPKTFKFAI